VRPGKNGTAGTEREIDRMLADRYNLASGDVVEGETESIPVLDPPQETVDDVLWEYDERDEPAAVRGERVPLWLVTRTTPTERLISIRSINGLPLDEALERPSPRLKRSSYERASPSRWIPAATSSSDSTGRILDVAAPLGAGYAGIIYGSHGSGLTHTLHSVARGVLTHARDSLLIILLMRARSEEITDWRRRFPEAEIVVCPAGHHGATAEQTMRVAELVLSAAQRQTELGRDVVLLIDSVTGLWGSMLENEEAEGQREADRAWSRQRIREWMQAAGNFAGEGLLGSGLGGSLTVVGSVWNTSVDSEAEEEGEIHSHLRLLEHVLPETGWRIALSGTLAADRLFPAIDTSRCLSQAEDSLLPGDLLEKLMSARQSLSSLSLTSRYERLMSAIESTSDMPGLLESLQSLST